MVKLWIEIMNDVVRNMLSKIRTLNEDAVKYDENNDKVLKITKTTPQFGDVRESQEASIKKTIGENVELGEDALLYYPKNKDLVFTGKITSANIDFQFRYNDPSGDGCYIWANATQLTDANLKIINKCRDAFLNWKDSLLDDGDLMERLRKSSEE